MTVAAFTGDSTESPVLVLAPPGDLAPHPDNPRRVLGDLGELAASIEAHGVLEPLIVVPVEAFNAAHADRPVALIAGAGAGVRWVVVAGHRRHAAAELAGAATVPVLVRADLADPAAALEVMLAENVQRAALTPLEEARAFARLRAAGRSQRDIAARLGCAQSQVSKRLALLDLPAAAQAAVEGGRLQLADAAELAKLAKYPDRLAKVLDAALMGIRGIGQQVGEQLRRGQLEQDAVARGARLIEGRLPRDVTRRMLTDPDRIAATGAAGTLGAFVSTVGKLCYLDLADPLPGELAEGGAGGGGADGPEVGSSGAVTVRRIDPERAEDRPVAGGTGSALEQQQAQQAAAQEAAEAQRNEQQAAELARDEVCQRLVAGFAADPGSAVPWLAGHVLRDQADDEWYSDVDRAQAWLATAGLAVYEVGEEPGVFAWLRRSGDPATAVLVAAALALAAAERRLTAHGLYSTDGWDIHDLTYLDQLTAAGHVLSDWERRRADQIDTTCTATDDGACAQPYGHPGDCDPDPAAAGGGAGLPPTAVLTDVDDR